MAPPSSDTPNAQKESSDQSVGFGIFKSLTRSLRSGRSNRTLPVSVNPTIVGGDATQSKLLESLKNPKLSDSNKVSHIRDLDQNLKTFTISSVPEIWYQLKSFLNDGSSEVRRQALHLLNTCVSLSDHAVPTKLSYYDDIINTCKVDMTKMELDDDLGLFLDVLVHLTREGQDVYELWVYSKRPLGKLLVEMLTIIQQKLQDSKPQPQELNGTITKLVDFLASILEFNYNILEEEEVLRVLPLVLKIANSTIERTTLASALGFVDALVLYGTLPMESLYDVMEILSGACTVSKSSGLEFDKIAWNILGDLSKTTNPSLVVYQLCQVLETASGIGILTGAIRILAKMTEMDVVQAMFTFAPKMMDSLTIALSRNPKLNDEIMNFLKLLFESEKYRLMVSLDFMLDDRSKIWKLLKEVQKHEGNREIVDPLLKSLQKLFLEKETEGLSLQPLVEFFNQQSKLNPQNAKFVLETYRKDLSCLTINTQWYENCDFLLSRYTQRVFGADIRRQCLETVVEGLTASLSLGPDLEQQRVIDLFMSHWDVIFDDGDTIMEMGKIVLVDLWVALDEDIFNEAIKAVFERLPTSQYSVELAKLLIETMLHLSISATTRSKMKMFICGFLRTLDHALTTSHWQLYLTVSRLMVRLRINERALYFTNPQDLEGLSDTMGRLVLNRPLETAVDWSYPEELSYIPEKYLDNPESVVETLNFSEEIRSWFHIVNSVFSKFYDWEVYSFTWCHFCPQLANIDLFLECKEEIAELMKTSCDNLQLKFPAELKLPPHIQRSNVQVAVVRTFSALIGYRSYFSRHEEDMIIGSMISGLNSWEKTGIPCINFLTIACYEFPLSVKKYLAMILTNLQIRISSSFASPHILEFLNSLSQTPDLILDFTLDEFKRVFAIAFKYIQYSHDSNSKVRKRASVDFGSFSEATDHVPSTSTTEMTTELSQYLSSLSYGVICKWFLKLGLDQRRSLAGFIVRNLILSSPSTALDDQTLAYIDLISKSTFSEFDFKASKIERVESPDVDTKRWIHGLGILTIKTNRYTGASWISMRRPTGSVQFKVDLVRDRESHTVFSPNFLLLQLVVPMTSKLATKPVPLVSDVATLRSIGNFDRIPVVDFYKVGVIYAGLGQRDETQMLANRSGSKRYHSFLNGLGDVVRLKGYTFPSGGLDTENDDDGEFALAYSAPAVQMIYHTTTMMPNDDQDPFFNRKKRHVGNDFVCVYYNDSGAPLSELGLLKTQFNFINIVVEPCGQDHYRVKLYRRHGLPPLFAVSHFKIVSAEKLPTLVTHFAILASEFAHVWNARGEYVSNWSHRVRQIRNIMLKNSVPEPDLAPEGVLDSLEFDSITG
ncbi:unnamed protein product [Kuraishia capsulata CBS 1993]|uniref:Rap-GAP domain-containing protein n=1 Tax=Kuraishia capsulata CBS 1993 TaxID=1382522 RepID=W6MUS4_9ASCO|nr:uncharacterized protein KUCA_T00001851001 [Kuraishia capsulata CBS 1993]CDK25880.1 unnamed protein product [Kuraishia capsulata CBS 1993]